MADLNKYIKRWNQSLNGGSGGWDYVYPITKWGNILSKPSTLSGYGITDAKIENGTITLGGNTITPLTDGNGVISALGYTPGTSNLVIGNTGSTAAAGNHNHDSTYLAQTLKGAASGLAELDSNGKVPSSQLPSYVDDVIEGYLSSNTFYLSKSGSSYSSSITGESGKIYVDKDTNKTYRWGGSSYTEISESLALGETSSTAYRGDRGAMAYAHAMETGALAQAYSSGLYKFSIDTYGHVNGVTTIQKSDITALGIPGSDTNTWRPLGTGATDAAAGNHNHDGRYIRFAGSAADANAMSWGTLTAANGYTILSHASSSDGGDWGMVYKNGQIFMQLDGYFYQNEGAYRCLDTSDIASSVAAYNHTHDYLPLSGGAVSGMITRDAGGSWISARDNVIIKTTRTSANGSDWHPIIGAKTSDGFWSLGSVGGETLCLSYDTDTDYNNSSNNSSVIYFPTAGSSGTLALTSQIPSSLPASDVYAWAKASTKPSYSYSEISGTPSSLPASDVYSWAKASTKPSYSWIEITDKPSSLPASDVYAWAKASSKPSYAWSEITDKPSVIINAGATPALNNGTAITQPAGDNAMSIKTSGSQSDTGILFISDDAAYVCNSGDSGYVFGVFDKDVTQDFSSADNAAFVVLQSSTGAKMKGNFDVGGYVNASAFYEGSVPISDLYAAKSHSHNYLTSSDIADMATQTWVGQQGYLTSHQSVSSSNNTASWGSAVTVGTVGGVNLKFTMPSNPNSNTATAADNILDGSNSGTEITYKPYTSQQSKLSFDTSSTNPSRSDRLNLNGYLYATKLYSGGTEVSVSGHTHNYAAASHDHSRLSYYTSNPSNAPASGYIQFCKLTESQYNNLSDAQKRDRTVYILT